MEYACQVWHTGLTNKQSETLESIQKRAMMILSPDLSYGDALAKLGLPTLHDRREHLCRRFFQAILQPEYRLHHLVPEKCDTGYGLRNSNKYPPSNRCTSWEIQENTGPSRSVVLAVIFLSQWAKSSHGPRTFLAWTLLAISVSLFCNHWRTLFPLPHCTYLSSLWYIKLWTSVWILPMVAINWILSCLIVQCPFRWLNYHHVSPVPPLEVGQFL